MRCQILSRTIRFFSLRKFSAAGHLTLTFSSVDELADYCSSVAVSRDGDSLMIGCCRGVHVAAATGAIKRPLGPLSGARLVGSDCLVVEQFPVFIRLIGSSGWKAGTRNTSMLLSWQALAIYSRTQLLLLRQRMGIAFLTLVHIVDLATTAPSPTPATLLRGYNQTTTLALDGGAVFFSSLRSGRSKPDSGRSRPAITERLLERRRTRYHSLDVFVSSSLRRRLHPQNTSGQDKNVDWMRTGTITLCPLCCKTKAL